MNAKTMRYAFIRRAVHLSRDIAEARSNASEAISDAHRIMVRGKHGTVLVDMAEEILRRRPKVIHSESIMFTEGPRTTCDGLHEFHEPSTLFKSPAILLECMVCGYQTTEYVAWEHPFIVKETYGTQDTSKSEE